jgi:hypothetical protein
LNRFFVLISILTSILLQLIEYFTNIFDKSCLISDRGSEPVDNRHTRDNISLSYVLPDINLAVADLPSSFCRKGVVIAVPSVSEKEFRLQAI